MSVTKINLISIGYSKRALEKNTRERERMKRYASVLESHRVIVFSRKKDGLPPFQRDGNLFLYSTNARTRLGIMWKAFLIGKRIVKENSLVNWIVSSQDPFETSLVGRAIARPQNASHHVQVHGDIFNPLSYKESFLQRVRFYYGKFVVTHSGCIRVVSERVKKSLVSLGVQPEKVTVLPIQADLESFLKVGHERLYTSPHPTKFLYIGRFSPEKNLLMLLQAFKKVAETNPDITLTLVGDGPEINEIKNFIDAEKLQQSICLKKWTDNVPEEMKSADALCLTSNHEGWGMVLVEAAAAGLPVITTRVGCADEFIINNEQGKVVDVADLEGFAEAMEMYCSRPELVEEHGRNGHQAASRFVITNESYLQQFVDSYTR